MELYRAEFIEAKEKLPRSPSPFADFTTEALGTGKRPSSTSGARSFLSISPSFAKHRSSINNTQQKTVKKKGPSNGICSPKRSLGSLRKTDKTKPRSPNFTGKLKLQRLTMEVFAKQFKETDAEEIDCCIAGWRNEDKNGPYLSVELSPKYVARRREPLNESLADFI